MKRKTVLARFDALTLHRLRQLFTLDKVCVSLGAMVTRFVCLLGLLAGPLWAAELKFDFGAGREGDMPAGFRSAVTGQGKPGEWKVLLEETAPLLEPLSPGVRSVSRKPVLAQVSQDPTDEHFPLLIYEGETFGDFTLTTRFKTVSGKVEQMAGLAFRIQNETNYYVVRASSLGNTFRFYKVLNGQRGPLVGPEMPIASNVWHELTVDCKGNEIRCLLNGKELVSVTDKANPFVSGKVGFWTKSDSVSYFADTKLVYTRFEPPAQTMLRELAKKYSRLVGLQVFVSGKEPGTTRLIASKDEKEVGGPGGKTEIEVMQRGETYYGKDKEKGTVSVIAPLRDRNGDVIAAVRVIMKSFAGQTEQNAIARATPVTRELQSQIRAVEDLTD